MSQKFRKILYLTFVLLFFIITPIVVGYAAGYKLSFSPTRPLQFQKTGMLILDTSPTGAKIYINDKIQQSITNKYLSATGLFSNTNVITTPTKLRNLLPGEYDVRMEKDGYWSWGKKLTVKSGESTFAEDVFLFKNDAPLKIYDKPTKIFSSPNNNYLAFPSGNKLGILKIKNDEIKYFNTEKEIKSLAWSGDSLKILTDEEIFFLENLEKIKINIPSSTPKNLKWSPDDNSLLFFQKDNTILSYNILTEESKNIISQNNILDYYITENSYYLVTNEPTGVKLFIYSSSKELLASIGLNKSNRFSFVDNPSDLIGIHDLENSRLYLINQNNFQPKDVIEGVKNISWIDKKSLIYSTDYEIWIDDLENGEKSLVTRISQPIKDVFWHTSNNYIIYASEKGLYAIELDKREKRTFSELLRTDSLENSFLNKKGDTLYFAAKFNNDDGLYKLLLH